MPGLEAWWRQHDAIDRFIGDLVAGELARLRPGTPLPPRPWAAGQSLVSGDLACDSLELLNLATALTEALGTHRAGVEDHLLARRTLADWSRIAAAGLERFSAEVAFRTSGSMGTPKTVRHPLERLIEEVEAHARIFAGRRRVVSAVPAHHIYGFLFTVLLPQALGASVLDVRAHSPAGVSAVLRDGDLVVGHPAFWDSFARAVDQAPAGVVGVTSTAPCPPETARGVIAAGLARLVEIYGSSETAGVGWRDSPDGPFELLPYWRRGAESDDLVRGEEPAQGPDRLAWLDDGRFQVQGRRDEAVQVGGVNVFPAAVKARLTEHPAVREAAVRLMRPEEGARLKAFIVPHDLSLDPDQLRRELDGWCANALSAAERPKAFSFGPALPRGALDKLVDWSLLEGAQ